MVISRLMCPRQLDAQTNYVGCVVPSFLAGVRRPRRAGHDHDAHARVGQHLGRAGDAAGLPRVLVPHRRGRRLPLARAVDEAPRPARRGQHAASRHQPSRERSARRPGRHHDRPRGGAAGAGRARDRLARSGAHSVPGRADRPARRGLAAGRRRRPRAGPAVVRALAGRARDRPRGHRGGGPPGVAAHAERRLAAPHGGRDSRADDPAPRPDAARPGVGTGRTRSTRRTRCCTALSSRAPGRPGRGSESARWTRRSGSRSPGLPSRARAWARGPRPAKSGPRRIPPGC